VPARRSARVSGGSAPRNSCMMNPAPTGGRECRQGMRRVDAARVREVLSGAPLLHGLPARRLQRLLAASRLESYAPGQVIVREGALGDAFYVVIQGAVVVQVSHGAGDVTRLATLGPGNYF